MKTILISLIIAFTSTISFAQTSQDSSAHMTFKGIPIDGTLNQFVSEMKKSGFTQISTEDGIAIFQGDFAGYKECHIGVATSKQKDLVSKVTVIFPECNTWSTLSSNYLSLKELLTEKYGEPSEIVEKFVGLSPDDDNDRMYKVGSDNCKYSTTYETEKGSIQLSIEHSGFNKFVTLTYYDKINSKLIREKAIDDL